MDMETKVAYQRRLATEHLIVGSLHRLKSQPIQIIIGERFLLEPIQHLVNHCSCAFRDTNRRPPGPTDCCGRDIFGVSLPLDDEARLGNACLKAGIFVIGSKCKHLVFDLALI